jgi:hypothetical protein
MTRPIIPNVGRLGKRGRPCYPLWRDERSRYPSPCTQLWRDIMWGIVNLSRRHAISCQSPF